MSFLILKKENIKLPISGTLTIRFKSENILGTRNILIVESINKKIKLFINGNINIIGCIVRHNRWNTLFVTYSEDGVKVKLNNYKLASIIEDNMLLENNMKYNIYLGCYINNLNEPVDHLNGKLEMFGYSAYILTETEMDDIIQKGGLFGVSKKYDETSRITENRIATPDNVLLTKYRYNDKTKLNPYIVSEELPSEEENIYEYDNMGNIIKILTLKKELYSFLLNTDTNYDSIFFIKGIEYKYDEFNRLQNEKHYSSTEKISKEINYEYNSFGNIISKTINNEKYNYNYTNYLLTSVEKEATEEEIYKIEYDKMYPFKITKNNITYELSWKQNQLIKYGDITFEYNEEGERTKKITPNKTIEYIYSNGKIVRSKNNNTIIDYHYDESGLLVGLTYNNKQYFYIRDILGNIIMIIDNEGNHMVKYSYDGYGKPTISTYGSVGSPLASNNIFLYKGYCYDVETNLALVSSRYYSPELGRFIQPADVTTLNPSSVNGLNLYSYANNNPIGIAYRSSSASGSVGEGVVNSIGKTHNLAGNNIPESASRITLPAVPWLVENATTMYGAVSSLISGVPIFNFYWKYRRTINQEFKLYGISKWKTSLQLSNVNLKMGALDGALIGVNVLIDMYDSYQRGVSTEGILLGGALTAASGALMFYTNKGIMWVTTTIGTAICPGLGTAIGFGFGLIGSILLDVWLGNEIEDWIDNNIK